ncbi:hypothetical protein [Pseudonocardia spirodelae]|uniref:Basic proline-rich protein n=1 Tax=Pseudonocardia spirodelae TaxID=3133431 RepID=A0ABU8T6X9_9PSEU
MSDPTYRLLRELAGRVDDDLLATGRELVAVGEEGHALELLVAELVAARAVLPAALRAGLVAAASARRVQPDAGQCLPAAGEAAGTAHRFTAEGPPGAAEAIAAALDGVPSPGTGWTLAWRTTPAGAAPGPLPQPVLLARTGPGGAPEVLTYQAQSALARAGLVVSVEVGDGDAPDPGYHRAADDVARPLPVGTAGAGAPEDGSSAGPGTAPSSRVPSDVVPHDRTAVTEPAGTAPAATDPAPADPADHGPADHGPADPGPADPGPVDLSPTDLGPADLDPTDLDPTDDGRADPVPTDTSPTDTGPTGIGAAGAGPVGDALPGDTTAPGPGAAEREPDGPAGGAPGAELPAVEPLHPDSADADGGPAPADPVGDAPVPPGAGHGTPTGEPAAGPETPVGGLPVRRPAGDAAHGTGDLPSSTGAGPAPGAGTFDAAVPGPGGPRSPAGRRSTAPAGDADDTPHPAPRPSPPIRALREASAGDWFDAAGDRDAVATPGHGLPRDLPGDDVAPEPAAAAPPDTDGAHASAPGPAAGPEPSPAGDPGAVREPVSAPFPVTGHGHPGNGATGNGAVPHVNGAGPAPVPWTSATPPPSPVAPVPGVPPAPPAAVQRPAGRPPVGPPAAPAPDEAAWLADWASGSWTGVAPHVDPVPAAVPEPGPAPRDGADPAVRGGPGDTVPGTPRVVPAVATAVEDTPPAAGTAPGTPAHAADAVEPEQEPVAEPRTPPGVPMLPATVVPGPATGERRPRHLLVTEDDDEAEAAEDPTAPADVVVEDAPEQPGPAAPPRPRPQPRPRPSGGLADRLTPTEQELLQRLHEELAARETGGEPTPRNGTARTDRG